MRVRFDLWKYFQAFNLLEFDVFNDGGIEFSLSSRSHTNP